MRQRTLRGERRAIPSTSMTLRAVALAVALLTVLLVPGDSDARRIKGSEERAVEIAALPCLTNLQTTSSGFVIDDRLIVTVAHAIYESRDFAVRVAGRGWQRPIVRYMDLERDLAVLELGSLRASEIGTAEGRDDQRVRLIEGAASGTVPGVIARRVNIRTDVVGARGETAERAGYELALDIDPGDSGAAIVDQNDDLVAIVFARSTRRDGVTWATSAEELTGLLDRRGVPAWDCGPGFGTELQLRRAEPAQLAG